MINIKRLVARIDRAFSDRQPLEADLDDIIRCFMPQTAQMNGIISKRRVIYDEAAVDAFEKLCNIIQSMICSADSVWFEEETDDDKVNAMPEVKKWLAADAQAMRKELNASNFYEKIPAVFKESIGLGPGYIFPAESKDVNRSLYFESIPMREVAIGRNDEGRIDSFYRRRVWTARQIMDHFRYSRLTGTIPARVRKAYDSDNPEESFTLYHAVMPNPDHEPGSKDNRKLSYTSIWIDAEEGTEITRGGFHEQSIICFPWSDPESSGYPKGRGIKALPAARSLYAMKRSSIRVGQKIADPPVNIPDSSDESDLSPGGHNYYESGSADRTEPIVIGRNFGITLEMMDRERDGLRNIFYLNQLQLIDRRQMTAEEVRTRTYENSRVIAPEWASYRSAMSDMLFRVRSILGRMGKLPAPPEAVLDKKLNIRFTSTLAKMVAQAEVEGISRTVGTAMAWSDRRADVLDNLDLDAAIRRIADLDGAPPDLLLTKDQVKQLRDKRQAEADKARELAMLQAGATVRQTNAKAGQMEVASAA